MDLEIYFQNKLNATNILPDFAYNDYNLTRNKKVF